MAGSGAAPTNITKHGALRQGQRQRNYIAHWFPALFLYVAMAALGNGSDAQVCARPAPGGDEVTARSLSIFRASLQDLQRSKLP